MPPLQLYNIYICITRKPNWGIHAARVFLKEILVTQTEKQIETQFCFNKNSGGPKNKGQNF